MKTAITIEIDTNSLPSVSDQYLAQCWHIAQANPKVYDRDAGELAEAIGREIIRRWLKETGPELYHHQGRDYYWNILVKHGRWNEQGEWIPGVPDEEGRPQCA